MALGRLYRTRRFSSIAAALRPPGRQRISPIPPRAFDGRRAEIFSGRFPVSRISPFQARRLARGGFFKSIFKGVKKVVKTVTRVPVVGAVIKSAVRSLPVVGAVSTAVGAIKQATAVGVAASPVKGHEPPLYGGRKEGIAQGYIKPRRRRKAKAKRKAKGKRRGGGTAKQRAARARFAKAAKKGRIRKGTKL